jgi:hypothetical protein
MGETLAGLGAGLVSRRQLELSVGLTPDQRGVSDHDVDADADVAGQPGVFVLV